MGKPLRLEVEDRGDHWMAFDRTGDEDGGCLAYGDTEAHARELVMYMRGMKVGCGMTFEYKRKKGAS